MTAPDARQPWFPAAASAALALLLYAVTLGGTYIYDDRPILQQDPRLTSPSRWGLLWTRDYFNGGPDNLYRPLVSTSYALQVWSHGATERRAWIFHLVNWLLHAGVCALTAEMARRLAGWRVALIAGLLFAAHPIHVEVVANIVGRAELLCAAGMIGAVVLLLNRPMSRARAGWISLCLAIALLSKEQGMLLPLIIAAAWRLRPRHRDELSPTDAARDRRGAMLLLLLVCWITAGYVGWREYILKFWWERAHLDWTLNPLRNSAGADRILVPVSVFGRYTALLIAPTRLSIDYGANVIRASVAPSDPYLWLGVASALTWLTAFAASLRWRARVTSFSLFSFGILCGLVLNLVALIGTSFNERLMYIPSAFFILLVAVLLARVRRRLMITILSIILVLFSARTVTYAWQWNDRERLYSYLAERQPESVRIRLLLAFELTECGRLGPAAEHLRIARQIEPGYYKSWLASAEVALAQGDFPSARAFVIRAVELDPRSTTFAIYRTVATRAATQP